MSDETYTLQLAFDSDDPEFCRGFEAADVLRDCQMVADGEHPHKPDPGGDCGCPPGEFWSTVHATNAEMMLRIAEATGLAVRSEEVEGGWMFVCFTQASEDRGLGTDRTEDR